MMRLFLVILGLLCCALPALAGDREALNNPPATMPDLSGFRTLPILHDGRLKPLDSFARHYLEIYSGKTRFDGRPAIDWLARILFEPAAATEGRFFLIRTPHVLGLPADTRHISYEELSGALLKKQKEIQSLLNNDPAHWNADQRALITYHENATSYTQIFRALYRILPLAMDVPPAFDTQPPSAATYLDMEPRLTALQERAGKIMQRKQAGAELTPAEEDIAAAAGQLRIVAQGSAQSALVKIIPAPNGIDWLTPWQADPGDARLKAWQALAAAWQREDAAQWHTAVQSLQETLALRASIKHRLTAEQIYNAGHPLGIAMLLYLLAFLAASLHAIFAKPVFYRAALLATGTGLACNAAAIGLRVFILARPPVGTLYESIIFVAAIAVIGGLLFERRPRDGRGLMAAALSGGLLLFIADAFATDDTMKVLVAVLNTNFWLATHVLCITIGYGWCILTALFAHFYLVGRAAGRLDAPQQAALARTTQSLALIALLFTAVGTILGGIWADQSWGRFWGWDPKENGALLIVLWLAWCLHGLIAGQLKRLPFMAVVAMLNIIVALAWFGVNLLNTGLHSYGFIEGVALALFAFCLIEITLIGGLWWYVHRRERQRT